MAVNFDIQEQPVGCIVYAISENGKLSLGELAKVLNREILEITKIIATEGGFTAEPKDALAFFLFKDRAEAFIKAAQIQLLQ